MQLTSLITEKLKAIPDGDHSLGLSAVLTHIQTASRHYDRARKQGDETAFTDAIYRSNQAFEGSIKEAYRVLASKDPSKKTPHEIEKYLESKNIFRGRVLNQFTTYRTEWRNPSTHDYRLDFDSNEAFLAIVSVTAFACLLADQISQHLAFVESKTRAEGSKPKAADRNIDLLERCAGLIADFVIQLPPSDLDSTLAREFRFFGELSGYFSVVAPDIKVESDVRLSEESRVRADLILSTKNEKIIVELKLGTRATEDLAAMQVERYMAYSGIEKAIILLNPRSGTELSRRESTLQTSAGRILVMAPK